MRPLLFYLNQGSQEKQVLNSFETFVKFQ